MNNSHRFRAVCVFVMMGLLLSAFTFLSVNVKAAPKISKKKLTLVKGQKKRLRVKGTKKKVRWRSSNKSVAAVNGKGVVKAKKKGKTTITAKVNRKKFTCRVTVKKRKAGNPSGAGKNPSQEKKGSGSINGLVMGPDKLQPFLMVNDANAIVLLVPVSGAKGFTFTGSDVSQFNNPSFGVYATRVDSNGRYWINNVTEGDYQMFIISMLSHGKVGASSTRFRQHEDTTPWISCNYYRFPQVIRQYFNETTASQIEAWAMSRTVIGKRVTIADGVVTQFGFDFKEYGKFF